MATHFSAPDPDQDGPDDTGPDDTGSEECRGGQGLVEVLDEVKDSGDGARVTVGALLDRWGDRAFGPLLLVPALLAVAPAIGAIPGMSIGTAAFIMLVAVQRLAGRRCPWLPGRLRRVGLPQRRLDQAAEWLKPYMARLEKVLRPRWPRLSQPPFTQLVALACIALAILMIPLAFVPFGVLLPGAAIAILAAGLTVQDGLVMTLGCAAGGAALSTGAAMLVGWI
jgi:hypothetical protein